MREGFAQVNHLYNKVVGRMHRLRLQPDGTHVAWLDAAGVPSVIWAFVEGELPASESGIWTDAADSSEGGKRMQRGHVYLRDS